MWTRRKGTYFLYIPLLQVLSLCSEYCENDVFTAKCEENEVIIMEKAFYGRMAIGQCLKSGHIGCFEDALPYFDIICSNKKSCDIVVSLIGRAVKPTCPEELRNVLEAKYFCKQGKQACFFIINAFLFILTTVAFTIT